MHNLLKNQEILNDIDSKRSSSRRFKVIICIIDQRASWTLLVTSVSPFDESFFFLISPKKGDNLYTKIML